MSPLRIRGTHPFHPGFLSKLSASLDINVNSEKLLPIWCPGACYIRYLFSLAARLLTHWPGTRVEGIVLFTPRFY